MTNSAAAPLATAWFGAHRDGNRCFVVVTFAGDHASSGRNHCSNYDDDGDEHSDHRTPLTRHVLH